MGAAYMSTGGSADAPPKCRRRRRENPSPPPKQSSGEKRTRDDVASPAPAPAVVGGDVASGSAPGGEDRGVAYGSVSLAGRSREMEDAVSVRPAFFRRESGEPLHFFAVFDGHGGSHVAALCKDRMHAILAEELAGPPPSPPAPEEQWLRAAMARSFARMDDLALTVCACGNVGLPLCRCVRYGFESEIVGSTAVVALVGGGRLAVANCGDSRAVLGRGGRAVALSTDHKPDRPDELARIEAGGGRVIYHNGARVHGILAMSRALGDRYLKPDVISEPEICIVERSDEDECLIIASDGLWDVIGNDLACDVARRCLGEGDKKSEDGAAGGDADNPAGEQGEGEASDSRCTLAATLLARLALGRQSADNISVIVIDLRKR